MPFLLRECSYGALGATGNWLFILLSGYFITAKSCTWRKVLRIWLHVFSLSAAIGVIVYAAGLPVVGTHYRQALYQTQGFAAAAAPLSVKGLLLSLLPTYFASNWFATSYLVFLLLVPLLEKTVRHLPRAEHKAAIIVLSILTTVVPLLPRQGMFHPSAVAVFVTGFFVAKYLRLYNPPQFAGVRRNLLCALGIFALISAYKIFWYTAGARLPFVGSYSGTFARMFDVNESVPVMLCALHVFCAFRALRLPHNRLVNRIAGGTFGVYLLHENFTLKHWWWHAVCKLDRIISEPWLFGAMLCYALLTFALCTVLELLRQRAVEACLLRTYSLSPAVVQLLQVE